MLSCHVLEVSSVILSSWSEVFDKMMNHDFKEHTQKEVVTCMELGRWQAVKAAVMDM